MMKLSHYSLAFLIGASQLLLTTTTTAQQTQKMRWVTDFWQLPYPDSFFRYPTKKIYVYRYNPTLPASLELRQSITINYNPQKIPTSIHVYQHKWGRPSLAQLTSSFLFSRTKQKLTMTQRDFSTESVEAESKQVEFDLTKKGRSKTKQPFNQTADIILVKKTIAKGGLTQNQVFLYAKPLSYERFANRIQAPHFATLGGQTTEPLFWQKLRLPWARLDFRPGLKPEISDAQANFSAAYFYQQRSDGPFQIISQQDKALGLSLSQDLHLDQHGNVQHIALGTARGESSRWHIQYHDQMPSKEAAIAEYYKPSRTAANPWGQLAGFLIPWPMPGKLPKQAVLFDHGKKRLDSQLIFYYGTPNSDPPRRPETRLASPQRFKISGTVSNLNGGLVVRLKLKQNNQTSEETLTIRSNGPVTFVENLLTNTEYLLSIDNLMQNRFCSIDNASGKVANRHIRNANIHCSCGPGQISGQVRNAENDQPIKDVTLLIKDQKNKQIKTILSEENGSFQTSLDSGVSYTIEFSKDGYLPGEYTNIILNCGQVEYLDSILQVSANLPEPGGISGNIKNSITGQPVQGLSLIFRPGYNNDSSASVAQTQTDVNGFYRLDAIDPGNYSVEVSGNAYITKYFNVFSIGGKMSDNQNSSINPLMSDDKIRVVLTWGNWPLDLDAHLAGPKIDSPERFHVYFNRKTYGDIAELDVDDTDRYGPETITVNKTIPGRYRYSVHDYNNRGSTNSSDLSRSEAKIELHFKGQIFTYHVPHNKPGTLWTVFEIDNGQLKNINSMSYETTNIMVNFYPDGSAILDTDANLIRQIPAKGLDRFSW